MKYLELLFYYYYYYYFYHVNGFSIKSSLINQFNYNYFIIITIK
jgi:hypothetical protein